MSRFTAPTLVTSLLLASFNSSPALAQGGGAPKPEIAPLELAPVATRLKSTWEPGDLSPEAVEKGRAALEALSQAHKGAKAMTATLDFRSRSPLGENSDSWKYLFGADGDLRFTTPTMNVTRIGDSVYVESDVFKQKLLRAPVGESTAATVSGVLNGPLPVPLLELREGLSGEDLVKAFGIGGLVEELDVAGLRMVNGREQILLSGRNGDVQVTLDPKTKLLSSTNIVFVPVGQPPEFAVALDTTFTPEIVEVLDPPITAPEAGERRIVTSLQELMQPTGVGEEFTFAFPGTDGKVVRSEDLKGKVVVLDFWATWCVPCVRSLPKLDEFARWAAAEGKPVEVYGVNVWERLPGEESARITAAKEYWSKQGFSFPTLVAADDYFLHGHGYQAIPVTLVIGPDGRIAAVHSGMIPDAVATLKQDVQQALDAAPTGG